MAHTVANVHTDFNRRQKQWARVRDALEGSDAIKEAGEAYLPKPDGLSTTAYAAYKRRAQFYPVIERTLRGMSGLVFRNPARYILPDRLEPLREAATTDGHSLEVMAEQIVNEVMSVGRYGLLVDYPTEVRSSDAVPYIATYTAENITDWRVQFVDGLRALTRVVLRDDLDAGEEDSNDEAEQRLELVLNPDGNYEVRRWIGAHAQKKKAETAAWVLVSTIVPLVNGSPLKQIPFVFINPYDLRPEVEKPPMLDLVDVNLGHYTNSADYEHSLFLTSQPTPWVSGKITDKDKPTAIGSSAFWILPEGAQAGMLEFKGTGVEAIRKAMLDKEDRLAALGARMIHEGRNRNEAADTARMRGRSELSLLTNVVNMTQAGIERALRIAAEWTGSNPEDVEVKLNRDWIETRIDPQELTALMKAWQSGAISHDTLWSNLQRGEVADIDRTSEDEKDMIEAEGGGMDQIVADAEAAAAAAAAPSPDADNDGDGAGDDGDDGNED